MERKIARNFQLINDGDITVIALQIIASLKDNEYLSIPAVLQKELDDLGQQFIHVVADASGGEQWKVAFKNDIRLQLIKKLREVANVVEKQANGELTALLSSGFPLLREAAPVVINKPANFRIMPGERNGEMILSVKRVNGAKSYLYEYTPDPITKDSVWHTEIGTKCRVTLQNLPLGVKFWFRMAAVGARSQKVYTQPLGRHIA